MEDWTRFETYRQTIAELAFKNTELVVGDVDEGELHTWPSGLKGVDDRAGGFYRCSVIGGPEKLGKSIIALRSSLLAAEHGWRVLYYDGEDGPGLNHERICNALAADREQWPGWMDNFTARCFGVGQTVKGIAQDAANHVGPTDEKILITLNSVNRLGKRMQRAEDVSYFQCLQRINEWAWSLSNYTQGRISTLLVSEVNRAGRFTGQDVEYAADLLLLLEKGDESREVNMVLHSRRTAGGDLGVYIRHYHACRFLADGERLLSDVDDDEDSNPQEGLGF